MTASSALTRREFLRGAAGVGAAAALGRPSLSQASSQPVRSRVVLIRHPLAQDEDHHLNSEIVGGMLDRAVCTLAVNRVPDEAWKRFFSPTESVGLKINVMMLPTPTSLQQVIIRRLHDVGIPAKRIRVADREARDLLADCAALINTCAFKTHWLSGVAGAVKNYLPFAPRNEQGDWSDYHPRACAAVGGVHHLPVCRGKTRLVIIDMLRPLFNGGPQVNPHYRWDYNGLVVSTDPVAADAVCLRIVQAKRRAVKGGPWPLSPPPVHVHEADTRYHVGQSRWQGIELVKLGWEEDALV